MQAALWSKFIFMIMTRRLRMHARVALYETVHTQLSTTSIYPPNHENSWVTL